jgi:hypothetical protein
VRCYYTEVERVFAVEELQECQAEEFVPGGEDIDGSS